MPPRPPCRHARRTDAPRPRRLETTRNSRLPLEWGCGCGRGFVGRRSQWVCHRGQIRWGDSDLPLKLAREYTGVSLAEGTLSCAAGDVVEDEDHYNPPPRACRTLSAGAGSVCLGVSYPTAPNSQTQSISSLSRLERDYSTKGTPPVARVAGRCVPQRCSRRPARADSPSRRPGERR